jgi:hypothetical protein
MMDIKCEVELFVAEFSDVESHWVGLAMRSLTNDRAFVERSEKILAGEARFTLLKRLALVRNVRTDILSEVESAKGGAAKLREKRDALAVTLEMVKKGRLLPEAPWQEVYAMPLGKEVWWPTAPEIKQCRAGTAKLQATLQTISNQIQTVSDSARAPL